MSVIALGYSQAVRQQTLNLPFPWFESTYPSQANLHVRLTAWRVFFIFPERAKGQRVFF